MCIAGALERKVWTVAFSGRTTYPSMYVLLIGGPGVGKTESIRKVRELWTYLPDLHVAPSSVSRASLVDALNGATREVLRPTAPNERFVKFNSLQVGAYEFGTFMTAYDGEFLSVINDLYDCNHFSEQKRSMKEGIIILQHGSGDNEQTWVVFGKAHWILDNLIAQGKARAMVVMMLNGESPSPAPNQSPQRWGDEMKAFQRELFEDALPLVEDRYRVEQDAAQRGIVGVSMGGGQSLTVGLGNLDRFAWVGSFSGVPPEEGVTKTVFANAASTNAKLRLLWLGCGQEDSLLKRNEDFVAKLRASGINYQWHPSEGGHSWPVWRGYLANFVPLLFQQNP